MTRGRVTANTKEQLMRVLWGELNKWHRLFIGNSLFKVTATAIFSTDPTLEKEWRIDAIPWSEDNPEAFAGLHNFGKRLLILCDEASALPNVIWEVLDGATTDANTQIIWIVTGNPTRNSGRFRDCFDKFSVERGGQWHCYQVDSRQCKFSNKKLIEKWRKTWGEDSDFFRVRVRGEFPNASTTQLISVEIIRAAQVRAVSAQPWEPLILGVDVARYGSNKTVACLRRGRDARTLPTTSWNGVSLVESAGRIAAIIAEHQPDAVFIDEGGVGGGLVDILLSLGHQVMGVNFSWSDVIRPGGTLVANKRAEIYVSLRDWLRTGGCIPLDDGLYNELVSIEYYFNKKDAIILVAKEDLKDLGSESPDYADAMALTFSFPVSAKFRGFAVGMNHKVDYDALQWKDDNDASVPQGQRQLSKRELEILKRYG